MRLTPIVALVLLATSCSSNDTTNTANTANTAATSSTAQGVASTTAATSGNATTTAKGSSTSSASTTAARTLGCRTPAGTVPAGVAVKAIPDVDGDGKADQAFFNGLDPKGGRRFDIVTAAGGRIETLFQSAAPIAASALVANVDQKGPVEIIISDNRTASLYAFVGCKIAVVKNPQGEQYQFDLGFRGNGTGVGCPDLPGGRQLVGLNVVENDGTTFHWKRTIIVVSGLTAHNGASSTGTFTRPADDVAIQLLGTISCGDRTIATDGVHEPEGG